MIQIVFMLSEAARYILLLRIAMPPKHEKHKFVKAHLYCMRVDVAVIIHRTQAYGQTSV